MRVRAVVRRIHATLLPAAPEAADAGEAGGQAGSGSGTGFEERSAPTAGVVLEASDASMLVRSATQGAGNALRPSMRMVLTSSPQRPGSEVIAGNVMHTWERGQCDLKFADWHALLGTTSA